MELQRGPNNDKFGVELSLRTAIIKCTGHVSEMKRLKAEIWYVVESFDRNFREAGMNGLPEKGKGEHHRN